MMVAPKDRALLASYGQWKARPAFNRAMWLERQRHYVAQDNSRRRASYSFKDSWYTNTLWSGQSCSVSEAADLRGGEYVDHKYTTAADRSKAGLRMNPSHWIQTTSQAMGRGGTGRTLQHQPPGQCRTNRQRPSSAMPRYSQPTNVRQQHLQQSKYEIVRAASEPSLPQRRRPASAPVGGVRRKPPAHAYGDAAPAFAPAPAPPPGAGGYGTKQPTSAHLEAAKDAINSRFDNMYKAFKSVDLDNSGRISRPEITRILQLCNIHITPTLIDELFGDLDVDGAGVTYHQFVKHVARDTVQQGTASWERDYSHAQHTDLLDAGAGRFARVESNRLGVGPKYLNAKQGVRGKSGNVIGLAKQAINSRFGDMRRAFKSIDLDNSGSITVAELEKALELWNVPIDPEEIEELRQHADRDGGGTITLQEFKEVMR